MDQIVTSDEMMVISIARQIRDGETVAQGLATPIVAAGYLLARATTAPNIYIASAIGQSMCRYPAPLGLINVERLWLDRSLINIGFVRAAADILPSLKPKEFFRPAQVDPAGNFNNIAFGKGYIHGALPRLRLPGVGGIPDVTTFINDICLYVPRHSRLTFVQELDLRSGLGHSTERKKGSGPVYLVTNMGQFDFANGRMRITSYHPGFSVERIQSHTGFKLDLAPDVHETPLPTPEELYRLRHEIDPLNIRRLELLSGPERRQLLRKIITIESQSEQMAII